MKTRGTNDLIVGRQLDLDVAAMGQDMGGNVKDSHLRAGRRALISFYRRQLAGQA